MSFAQTVSGIWLSSTHDRFDPHSLHHYPPTLDEIQIRAYRVHREHGFITGGYTLDDWLEAERELEEEEHPASERPGKKTHLH
jgi:hypothetical protein